MDILRLTRLRMLFLKVWLRGPSGCQTCVCVCDAHFSLLLIHSSWGRWSWICFALSAGNKPQEHPQQQQRNKDIGYSKFCIIFNWHIEWGKVRYWANWQIELFNTHTYIYIYMYIIYIYIYMLLIEYKSKCNIVHVISWCFKQTEYFHIFPANSWSHLISTLPKQQPALLAQCNNSTHYFRIHSIKNSYTYKIWNAFTHTVIDRLAARGLTFAGKPPNSMWDCNLLCCSARVFRKLRAYKILILPASHGIFALI